MKQPLIALLTTLSVLGATPAFAETIHLKNGAHVQGKITKEDSENFVVETKEGRRKVPKKDIEVQPPPDPTVAFLMGLLIAGGGHVYEGVYDRAALFLTTAGLGAGAGYWAARQIRPSSPSTAAVTALVVYSLPMLIGAYDAGTLARKMAGEPKYHIDYAAEAE